MFELKEIPLTQGKVAIVDDCDYEYVSQWKWAYDKKQDTARHYDVRLHRLVAEYAGLSTDKQVVCLNGLRLDCRRENLAVALKDRLHRVKKRLSTVLSDGARCIPISQNMFAVVDPVDYEYLSQWSWHRQSRDYAARWDVRRLVYMHQVVAIRSGHQVSGMEVDHVDLDHLNNRRGNLRVTTRAQNAKNQGLLSNNTSGYKGVSWDKRRGKWRVHIDSDGVQYDLGRFEGKVEAARAYNRAALKYHGEFARLNPV